MFEVSNMIYWQLQVHKATMSDALSQVLLVGRTSSIFTTNALYHTISYNMYTGVHADSFQCGLGQIM